MSDIEHPSSVLLLGEAVYAAAPNPFHPSLTLPYAKNPSISACYVTNYIPSCVNYPCDNWFWVDTEYPFRQITPSKSCNALIALWHNNNMNALKVDGHVEQVSQKTLVTYTFDALTSGAGPNSKPGAMFWTDGKGVLAVGGCNSAPQPWYANQYPSGPWPYNQ